MLRITQKIQVQIRDVNGCQFWIGTNGYWEDELDELFERENELSKIAKAIAAGPDEGPHEMIRREMPLDFLLIVMTHLSRSIRVRNPIQTLNADRAYVYGEDTPIVLPNRLAKEFFETAPMTYGSLGVSSGVHDEVQRFIWSRLCWSPQPSIEDILESYGNWFFGATAAPYIRNALLALEAAWEKDYNAAYENALKAEESLKHAELLIPEKVRSVALPRIKMFKLRTLLDKAVIEKVKSKKAIKDKICEILSKKSKKQSTKERLQLVCDFLNESKPVVGMEKYFERLSSLQRDIFEEMGHYIESVERLAEPFADQNWCLLKLQTGLRMEDEGKQNEVIEEIIYHLQKKKKKLLYISIVEIRIQMNIANMELVMF